MKGYIHSFESLATLDGAGVRYGVFLQGCPLRCAYCHNPDTQSGSGIEYEAEDLVKKISRYKPYFGKDGGVTFSGGEPLLQAEFIAECASELKKLGINYVIDTSGAVELSHAVKEVIDGAQAVILDLKFWDDESYLRYTGRDMSQTLGILRYLEESGKYVWIRTVVVPGINDSEEIIERYLKHIKGLKCVERYELLAFHTMGFRKYEEMGISNPLSDTPDLEGSVKERLQRYVDERLR